MNRSRNHSASMFLMEMIAAVCFFILCAGICIQVFVKADAISRLARDTNQASLAAESMAELWKAGAEDVMEVLQTGEEAAVNVQDHGGKTVGNVYWDKDWRQISEIQDAAFQAEITVVKEGGISRADIRIIRLKDGYELFLLTARKDCCDE